MLDHESAAWLSELRAGGAVRERAHARLHDPLLGVAPSEDLDALCMPAANDALRATTDKLGAFRGDSRFTTWA